MFVPYDIMQLQALYSLIGYHGVFCFQLHAGALFSVIAMVQVIASNVATVVFFFFYPYTLNRGWGAGTVYFLMAAIAALPVPLVM